MPGKETHRYKQLLEKMLAVQKDQFPNYHVSMYTSYWNGEISHVLNIHFGGLVFHLVFVYKTTWSNHCSMNFPFPFSLLMKEMLHHLGGTKKPCIEWDKTSL